MVAFIIFLVLLVVAVLVARVLGLDRVRPWTRYLDKLQTVLTLAGVIAATVWFFAQRNLAAKLDVDQHISAVALDKDHVLLLTEVSVKNLGYMAIDFHNSPYKVFVTQVTPLTQKVAGEYVSEKGPVRTLRPAQDWMPLARLGFDARDKSTNVEANRLTSLVEPGETENLYFRVILDCQPGLSVYVMSRFAKPPIWYEELDPFKRAPDGAQPESSPGQKAAAPPKDERLYWIKQSFVDLRETCPNGGKAKPVKTPAKTAARP